MPTEILADPLQPLDGGQKLWRYMKLSTLLLLLKGSAFFPSVATLRRNDPLEGVSSVDPAWMFYALDNLQGKDAVERLHAWLLEKAVEWEKRVLQNPSGDGPGNNSTWAKLYTNELAKRRAIWCWFASEIESAAMWPIYGFNGVAVSTTVEALVQALPKVTSFHIARIRYVSSGPFAELSFNPEKQENRHLLHRPHLLKRAEYEHEREVRVVTICDGELEGELVEPIDWNVLVKGIVISPLIPHLEAESMKEYLLAHKWNIKPEIQRSLLLGSQITHDELSARMIREMGKIFGNGEYGLPRLLKKL